MEKNGPIFSKTKKPEFSIRHWLKKTFFPIHRMSLKLVQLLIRTSWKNPEIFVKKKQAVFEIDISLKKITLNIPWNPAIWNFQNEMQISWMRLIKRWQFPVMFYYFQTIAAKKITLTIYQLLKYRKIEWFLCIYCI
jgi:hypothetical protein